MEKPIFLKVENYSDVMSLLESIKEKLKESEENLRILEQLKEKEDNHIKTWNERLKTVEEEINKIKEMLKSS